MNIVHELQAIETKLDRANEHVFLLIKNNEQTNRLREAILLIQEALSLAQKLEDEFYFKNQTGFKWTEKE